MRNLIVYMTHHGTTQKVVERLADGLGRDDTAVVNLEMDLIPDITTFETVIVGGSIHIGQIQPKIKRFCEQQKELLLTRNLGLFLCFMNKELAQQEFKNAYPKELRDQAIAHGLFGGGFLIEKMNFVEKFIVKKVAKEVKTRSELDFSAIEGFIATIK